jgi:hypothetical protein
MSSRTKRMGESRWNWQRVRSTSPHTKDPSSNWRRCDFGCEMCIECPCLEFGQLRNHGESRSYEERECGGYLKDPPKAGSRWEKRAKNRLNQFVNRLNRFPPGRTRFTDLLSRRLDRTQNQLSWKKSGWTGFQKSLHTTFLTTLTVRLVRAVVAEKQSRNQLNRFQFWLNRFQRLKSKFWTFWSEQRWNSCGE